MEDNDENGTKEENEDKREIDRAENDLMIRSATGKMVRRGDISLAGIPEIHKEELNFGDQIGGGCFGSVYKGRCRGFDVAIKILSTQELDPKTLEDFRREVDILTQMRHPNVVLFMGACTEPGHMCIVTELMKDSVYGLLRKNMNLSLLQRIKICKDTAAGMAWLHGASPQIFHRDIKPKNLLIDRYLNVKVCDFGLSQVKEANTKILDGNTRPGTPLWMAPEVMLGRPVDEKADIYSYAIVMWEVFAGEEPFGEFTEISKFKRAIVKEHHRPPVPPNMPPIIAQLMTKCWDPDPDNRPPFRIILKLWDSVMLKCLVDDKVGRRFWKENFKGRDTVSWKDFATAFAALLKIPPPDSSNQSFKCLKKILATRNNDPNLRDTRVVNLEKFGHVVNWFGPLDTAHRGFTLLDKARTVMQMEWFHGDISRDEAEDLLAGQPKGTFLVRTSVTEKSSPFTLSKVTKKNTINHQRLQKRSDGLFEVPVKLKEKVKVETSKDDLLGPFLQSLAEPLYLKKPCPGSRYMSLFRTTKSEGYQ